MKKYLALLLFTLICSFSKAQILGSAVVCPGYVYTYNATIIGATSYTWHTPAGWLILSGQGSSQLQVMCNSLDGDICADGYDGGGAFVAQNCFTTAFGGDGVGWDADKTTVGNCICSAYTIAVTYNSSSSPCGGCGSGSLSPHAVFAVYDSIWPNGNLLGLADGVTQYLPDAINLRQLTVYLVDTTNGLANAVLIGGSPCVTTINNTVQLFPCSPPTLTVQIDHSPVCVGDTFSINENSGLGTFPQYQWSSVDTGLHFYTSLTTDSISGTYYGNPGSNPVVNLTTTDMFGCPYIGSITLDVVNCIAPPVSGFNVGGQDSICPGLCVTFVNTSLNGTEFRWYFPGADIDTSTIQNPPPICYGTSGSYDVALVAVNAGSTDSLYISNYITVFQPATPPILQLINDTLFANQGLAGYTWYFNGSLITNANQYFYVPLQDGNYTVEITDSNGCTAAFELSNVLLNVQQNSNSLVQIYPQPVTTSLNVSVPFGYTFELRLTDIAGRIIKATKIFAGNNQIDVSELSNGIYTLILMNEKLVFNEKILIEK